MTPTRPVLRYHGGKWIITPWIIEHFPPHRSYVDLGNAYRYEMTDDDHRQLAKVLHDVGGMVVLSGYHSQLYDEFYANWQRVEREAMADSAELRTEVLWLNPACSRALAASTSQGRLVA